MPSPAPNNVSNDYKRKSGTKPKQKDVELKKSMKRCDSSTSGSHQEEGRAPVVGMDLHSLTDSADERCENGSKRRKNDENVILTTKVDFKNQLEAMLQLEFRLGRPAMMQQAIRDAAISMRAEIRRDLRSVEEFLRSDAMQVTEGNR